MIKKKLMKGRLEITSPSNLRTKLMNNIDDNLNKNTHAGTLPTSDCENLGISEYFTPPLWKHFYDLEYILNEELRTIPAPRQITHIYNPVEYASEIHCAYLRRFLGNRTRRLMFVGMNPGANGMGQTGVPFGNISTVRDVMQLTGDVRQPANLHGNRPVKGLNCSIEEPSGVRIWKLLVELAGGSLDTFAEQCFLHNFCPLIFFDSQGRNITPNELKGDYKQVIRDKCLATLDQQIELLNTEIVVAVGEYVYSTLKQSRHNKKLKFFKLPHPSPRALNNQNWPEKAHKILHDYQLLKYLRNE